MPRGARLALAASLVARAAPSATAGGADPAPPARRPGPARARQNNLRAERVATIRESSGFQLTGRQTRDDSDRTVDIA